jgi:hypothetical protein
MIPNLTIGDLTIDCANADNPWDGTEGGNTTTDKV